MIERIDISRIHVLGGTDDDARRFVESDFKIRSGLCPNGHGLLQETDFGQACEQCGFSTNKRAEKVAHQ
ncbi:hypothetical protein [Dyella sp.]|uniref:hypothetical protein n=1 Tax=Dyella sp. TaxID=1869338 RepID=UPI002FD88DB0